MFAAGDGATATARGSYHEELNSATYDAYYSPLRRLQAADILEQLSRLPLSSRRLLDIGCGNGTFVSCARAAGFDAFGIDTSLPPRADCHAAGFLAVRSLTEQERLGERFAVVTLLNVIEHIAEPATFLQEVRRLVEPGSVLVLAHPLVNGSIYRACHLLFRMFGPRMAGPWKTLLQWQSSAPHVFLPTLEGTLRLISATFGRCRVSVRYQKIVSVRNLHKRVRLEAERVRVGRVRQGAMLLAGLGLAIAGRLAAVSGYPDEVFIVVETPAAPGA